MDNLKDLLKKVNLKAKEVKTKDWQFEALEAIEKLRDGNKNIGAIFKCFKTDKGRAKTAMLDSIELNKPYSRYFFKVFAELKKRYEE